MAVLTAHEHGKSRVRLGRTWRDASTRAHYFVEWEVAVRLISPAMDKAYTDGDNSGMTTTDTTRNMVRCVAFAYCVLQVFLSFVCVCVCVCSSTRTSSGAQKVSVVWTLRTNAYPLSFTQNNSVTWSRSGVRIARLWKSTPFDSGRRF